MFDIVLSTRSTSPPVMTSSTVGPSSPIFATTRGEKPARWRAFAVPSVATSRQPICTSRETMGNISGLSASAMVSSTEPPRGTCTPDAAKALRRAPTRVWSMPIASPVDFISGPRYESTACSLLIENTGALTATRSRGGTSPVW